MTSVHTHTAADHAADHTDTATGMHLSVLRSPAHTVVKLNGDLDVATAPMVRERLRAALHPGTWLLILDLSAVLSCDAAGAAVLIGTQRHATAHGIALRLAAPRFPVAKALRVIGLDRRLAIHATLSDALTRPMPGR